MKQENKEVSDDVCMGCGLFKCECSKEEPISVSDLLKQREDIEEKIRSIDPMALIHYELEQLQGKPEHEEPVFVSVEEAATNEYPNEEEDSYFICLSAIQQDAFKVGVNWQKEQDKSDIEVWRNGYLDYLSLKATLISSIVNDYVPKKEGISFHDAVALSIGHIAEKLEQDKELIRELLEVLELANGTLGSCLIMENEVQKFLDTQNIRKDRSQIFSAIEKANNYINQ